MTYKKVIVVPVDQLKIDDFWHIREILVVELSVDLLPTFLQLCDSNFLNF